MTDPEAPLEQVERAASELIPRLNERLTTYGLGEIEVREGTLRVRVARALAAPDASAPARPAAGSAGADRVGIVPTASTGPTHQGISSPAVGFFVYADGLGPGLAVEIGRASCRDRG